MSSHGEADHEFESGRFVGQVNTRLGVLEGDVREIKESLKELAALGKRQNGVGSYVRTGGASTIGAGTIVGAIMALSKFFG